MPKATNKRAGIGCLTILTIMGGFGTGVYCGFNEAKGIKANPLLLYGPTGLGGVLGVYAARDLMADRGAMAELDQDVRERNARILRSDRINELPPELRNQMYESAERNAECGKGCMPVFGLLGIAGLTAASTAAGYWLGGVLGRSA